MAAKLGGELQGGFEMRRPTGRDRKNIVEGIGVDALRDVDTIDARRQAGCERRRDLGVGDHTGGCSGGAGYCLGR